MDQAVTTVCREQISNGRQRRTTKRPKVLCSLYWEQSESAGICLHGVSFFRISLCVTIFLPCEREDRINARTNTITESPTCYSLAERLFAVLALIPNNYDLTKLSVLKLSSYRVISLIYQHQLAYFHWLPWRHWTELSRSG